MNWYKDNFNEWKEIIETVARETGRNEQMVEKDTIQSIFLNELSKSDLPFVFKGGTALSKAYDLIDRFSEDIDLSMNRKLTQSERSKSKETIITIADNLGLELSNASDIMSRYNYNKYIFKYDSMFSNNPLEIIVETSYYQTVYPVEQHILVVLLENFLCKKCLDLLITSEVANV